MIMPYATIIDAKSDPSLQDILGRDDMKPWVSLLVHATMMLLKGTWSGALILSGRIDMS